MIVWLNGAFGAGKTTVASALVAAQPSARHWHPERVGHVLRLVRRNPTGDFQDLPPWRRWVVRTGRWHARDGRTVVAVQSVLRPRRTARRSSVGCAGAACRSGRW